MTAWDQFLHDIALLLTAVVGIVIAFIGDMVRLFHEQERGGAKVTLRHVPSSLLRSMLMGIIATAVSQYLHAAYNVPELAGGALGGILGYLGPTVIGLGFNVLADRFGKPKE